MTRFASMTMLALSLFAAPALAADYVQAPGSALALTSARIR